MRTARITVSQARGSVIVSKEVSKEVETVDIEFDGKKFSPDLFELEMGSVTFLLKNKSDMDIGFFLYKKALSNLDLNQLEDRVYGFECANIPEFREMFSSDVLSHRENMQLSDLTILFTDISRSTGLYEKLGDVIAYNIVRDHFDILFKTVEENGGVVVKTIGDAVMASFIRPVDGVKAGVDALKAFEDYNRDEGLDSQVAIKVGLHHGPCIVVNLNDRLDYFGSVVNVAARVQGLSQGGEIWLSEAMVTDLRVKDFLPSNGVKRLQRYKAELKGLDGEHSVYKLDRDSYS